MSTACTTVCVAALLPTYCPADDLCFGSRAVTRHFGPKLCTQAEAEDGKGPLKRLINISSGAGHCTIPWQSAYTASKWAVEALSKATAQAMSVRASSPHHGPLIRRLTGHLPHAFSLVIPCVCNACSEARGLRDRFICVPLAPGSVASEMNTRSDAASLEQWAPVAARRILGLTPEDSGASVALEEFYNPSYIASWVIPSGLKAPRFGGW